MLNAALGVSAQPASEAAAAGKSDLELLWRRDGRKLDPNAFGAHTPVEFSASGDRVAIMDWPAIRILDPKDGRQIAEIADASRRGPVWSLAVSSGDAIAIGRSGSVEVYASASAAPVRYGCVGGCGGVAAAVFSPDGRHLAYLDAAQLSRQLPLRMGSVKVVDLTTGEPVLESAGGAGRWLAFDPKGERLIAADVGGDPRKSRAGIRTWDTLTWRAVGSHAQTLLGNRTELPMAATQEIAVYASDTALELRNVATDDLMWSTALIPPPFPPQDTRTTRSKVDMAAITPNGELVVTYESPAARDQRDYAIGAIVVRRATDGVLIAVHEARGVADFAVAPNSEILVYNTRVGETYAAAVQLPLRPAEGGREAPPTD